MSNKFSQQVNKAKGDKPKVGISDLLADSTDDALVVRARSEGRFLSLPPEAFIPDPNQPRKTFAQEEIDELRLSIETRGQLQPILVGARLPDGKYPIIAGERRWRAIAGSSIVADVQAIIRGGEIDELHWLLMQVDENNRRVQIPAIENALAMKRVVDICKAKGHDQAYAANLLGVSAGQLSKHLSLVDAPPAVASLSTFGETQDVEVLYNLAKAAESNPKQVEKLVEQWRSGELDGNLRQATKDLLANTKRDAKQKPKPKAQKNALKEPAVSDVDFQPNGNKDCLDFQLTLIINGKGVSYKVSAELALKLKQQINSNWQ